MSNARQCATCGTRFNPDEKGPLWVRRAWPPLQRVCLNCQEERWAKLPFLWRYLQEGSLLFGVLLALTGMQIVRHHGLFAGALPFRFTQAEYTLSITGSSDDDHQVHKYEIAHSRWAEREIKELVVRYIGFWLAVAGGAVLINEAGKGAMTLWTRRRAATHAEEKRAGRSRNRRETGKAQDIVSNGDR